MTDRACLQSLAPIFEDPVDCSECKYLKECFAKLPTFVRYAVSAIIYHYYSEREEDD